ncbi:MAG: RNA methyltransferase [Bacteroidia bacterium]|nr:RNA methyltransferase [Bacteroidia bacterium]
MQAISKAKIKLFTSLSVKKYRHQHGLFIVEGKKMVQEACQSNWKIAAVIAREDVREKVAEWLPGQEIVSATETEFATLSAHQNPEGLLAVLHFPNEKFCVPLPIFSLPEGPGFILDGIQDPGNLGTILRVADWFGFPEVILGPGTVDLLNPKTLRSSMGAIFRVNVVYTETLLPLINANKERIIAADLEGENLQNFSGSGKEFVVIGNEARGLSDEISGIPGIRKVFIAGEGGAESLNAAVSSGIFAWNLRYLQK